MIKKQSKRYNPESNHPIQYKSFQTAYRRWLEKRGLHDEGWSDSYSSYQNKRKKTTEEE